MNKIIDNQNALIEEIKFPELNSVEFASDLKLAFENINNNFAKLSNHDFIKGDPGKSVSIKSVDIYNGDDLSDIGETLKDFLYNILGGQREIIEVAGNKLSFWDNFTKDNSGSIQLIYNTANDRTNEEDILFSSLQYIFLDGRFWNESIGKIDLTGFDEIDDKSCIIIYDGENFKSLNNAFPTLYYEKNVGLCWKINGKKTGMPVQGISGRDGKNAIMRIVKVGSIDIDNTSEVIEIFENKSGYIDINNKDININDYDKSSALIIDENSKLYFGVLFIENNTLKVKCDQSSSLNDIQSSINVDLALKNIKLIKDTENPSHLNGLFIPINHEKEQNVHLISASSIVNAEGLNSTSETSDVIFTPIKNINDLNVSENAPLNVEKYLYVKVNNEYNSILEAKTDNNPNNKSLLDLLKNYNYCIKYKLKHIVTDKDDAILDPETIYGDEIFGVVNGEIALTKANVIYAEGDYTSTLPEITDKNPIYVWEQYAEENDFDIDELKGLESFNIPVQFKTIFTRTFTPGISSEIFWFNPLEILEKIGDNYKIKGWTNDWNSQGTESLFKILKFVPIFIDKDFHVSKDTAVNFNYNVNITGCNEDDKQRNKRNLTVHGDINCDNINVYKITATGEIDNIITPNTIYGDNGIKLGKSIDGYNFESDGQGNIKASTLDLSGDIKASNLDLSGNVKASTLDLSGNINTSNLTVGSADKSNSSASFENITEFNISGNGKKYGNESYSDKDQILEDISLLSKQNISNLPSVYTENGNIVVTDQNTNSPELYYTGMPKPYPVSEGNLKTSYLDFETNEIDFDNAKRFTFNRIKNKDYSEDIFAEKIENSLLSFNNNYINRKYSQILPDYKTSLTGVFFNSPKNSDNFVLEKFTLTADKKIHNSSHIKIDFNKPYIFHVNIIGRGYNGSYPILNKESKMYLEFYYQKQDNTLKRIGYQEYNFDKTETIWNGDVYTENGSIVSTEAESSRIKSYYFKPNNFYILNTEDDFKAIKDLNNSGNNVTIYVIPKFSITVKSSINKLASALEAKTIKGIEVYFPVSQSDLISSTTNILNLTKQHISVNSVKIDNTANAVMTYNYFIKKSENTINSTTICKDGVLFRANNYMFGLGYSKDAFLTHDSDNGYKYNENKVWENSVAKTDEPILFYYKSVDAHDMKTTGEEIAKKINVITIDDLFTAIQLLKTKFSEEWSTTKNNNIFA